MAALFSSRKFWTLIVALIVVVIQVFVPDFSLDEQALVDLVIVAAAYMVGLALDPGDPMAKWANLLKSRKFWGTVVSTVFVFLNAFHVVLPVDFSPEQITGIILLISGYVVSVALEKPIVLDLGKVFGKLETEDPSDSEAPN